MKISVDAPLQLLHQATHITLATHSAAVPGYPYATALPNVQDASHCPVLCISQLAEHTKNLQEDSRVSVSVVSEPVLTVQSAPRMTFIGECLPFEPSPALVQRYLRYEPDAEQYLQLDFSFFRIMPTRIRFIGGVGRMGWVDAIDWDKLTPLASEDEQTLLAAHQAILPEHLRLLGMDYYGLDYVVRGQRKRHDFPGQPDNIEQLASALQESLDQLV